MDDKPAKPKRIGNHYIPPPARKQGAEPHDFSRIKERTTKLSGTKQEKLCDDSSLLFKDSSSKVVEKTKAKRKSKRSNRKANAENTSIPLVAETQPVLPLYTESDKAIFQHSTPHDTCDVSDKVIVKSHLPLNDLENTRSRDSNSVETSVKLMDSDFDNSRRLVVIPCSFAGHHTEDLMKGSEFDKAELRPDVDERVKEIPEAACDNVPESDVSVTEYPIENLQEEEEETGVLSPQEEDDGVLDPEEEDNGVLDTQEEEACKKIEEVSLEKDVDFLESNNLVVTESNTQALNTFNDLSSKGESESRSEPSTIVGPAFPKSCEPDSVSPCGPHVPEIFKSKYPNAKTRPPSDGCQDLTSVDDGDWDSIYDDSGDCLITHSATPSPKGSATQEGNDLEKMKTSPKQPVPEKTYENCSSIIEIYGFSEELKTNDLLSVFGSFINKGFNLKWVDNTHALGIFPSPFLAEEVLTSNLPLVKTRPIAQGTPLSQEKARNLVLPSSLRPKTCSALARRLVSGALGLRVKATPEERAAERELLREAREKKKLVTKQRDAAWEGNFSSIGCEGKETT